MAKRREFLQAGLVGSVRGSNQIGRGRNDHLLR